jgi:uncharacterized protein Veg
MLILGIVVMIAVILWQVFYPIYSQKKEEESKMKDIKQSLDKSVGPRNYILISVEDTRENEFARKASNKVIYNEIPVIEIIGDKSIDWGILRSEEEDLLDDAINQSYLKRNSIEEAVRFFDGSNINVYHRPPDKAHYLEPYES